MYHVESTFPYPNTHSQRSGTHYLLSSSIPMTKPRAHLPCLCICLCSPSYSLSQVHISTVARASCLPSSLKYTLHGKMGDLCIILTPLRLCRFHSYPRISLKALPQLVPVPPKQYYFPPPKEPSLPAWPQDWLPGAPSVFSTSLSCSCWFLFPHLLWVVCQFPLLCAVQSPPRICTET